MMSNENEACREAEQTAAEACDQTAEAAGDPAEAAESCGAEEPAESHDDAVQEANDKYLRLYAEFDNYRKRTAREKSETYSRATADCIEQLLPVLDSLTFAMKAECTDAAFKSGMEKICQQLTAILEKIGVKEMQALGELFDPNLHHAIKQVETEDYAEGVVCEVFQTGYLLGERVIRPAMVAVAS